MAWLFKYKTDNRTRRHSWAPAKERCKLDIRKYAFSQRTINEWNRLQGECAATSVTMFNSVKFIHLIVAAIVDIVDVE